MEALAERLFNSQARVAKLEAECERLRGLLAATDAHLAECQRSHGLESAKLLDPGCPWCADKSTALRAVGAENERLRMALRQATDAAEALWGVVANASGGNWNLETAEWQAAAKRARDLCHVALLGEGVKHE